jgi:hypothetical protein
MKKLYKLLNIVLPIGLILGIFFLLSGCTHYKDSEYTAVINIISGNNQLGSPNMQLSKPIVVQVTNTGGMPFKDFGVQFEIVKGGGFLNRKIVNTDDNGQAETLWTIGPGMIQRVKVTAADTNYYVEDIFVEAKTDRWAEIKVISGNNQTGLQGEILSEPLVVQVKDSYDQPVKDIKVIFEIRAGGGSLTKKTSFTDEQGLVELSSTLGTGWYQEIKLSISHNFYFAKYAFTHAKAEFNTIDYADAKWVSDITFYDDNGEIMPHDNRILETSSFLVFSDACSDEEKIRCSQIAEESFKEVKEAFDISSNEELGIYSNFKNKKITIYAKKYIEDIGSFAFPYGYIIDSYDSTFRIRVPDQWPDRYMNMVKHETVHLMQFFHGHIFEVVWVDQWFSEGLCEYVSGQFELPVIRTMDQLNSWYNGSDHINPIKIHKNSDFPLPNSRFGEYYPVFEKAVEYLVDKKGLGKTLLDVKEMFVFLKNTRDFELAFETYMGISLKYYEENFFDIMADFLAIY